MSSYEICFESIEQLANKEIGKFQNNGAILSLNPQDDEGEWKKTFNNYSDKEIIFIFIDIKNLKSIKGLPNRFLIKKLTKSLPDTLDYKKQQDFEKHDFSIDFSFEMKGKTYYIFKAPQAELRVSSSTEMRKREVNLSQGKMMEHLLKYRPGGLDWRSGFLKNEMFGMYTYEGPKSSNSSNMVQFKIYPHQGTECKSDGPNNPIDIIHSERTNLADSKSIFNLWSNSIDTNRKGKKCLGLEDATTLWKYALDNSKANEEVWKPLRTLIVEYISEVFDLDTDLIIEKE